MNQLVDGESALLRAIQRVVEDSAALLLAPPGDDLAEDILREYQDRDLWVKSMCKAKSWRRLVPWAVTYVGSQLPSLARRSASVQRPPVAPGK